MTQADPSIFSTDLQIDELMAEGPCDGTAPQMLERRRKHRLREPFPARICGVDSGDLPFNVDCVVENMSSTGLYLRMNELLVTGSEVRLIVHFVHFSSSSASGASASIVGEILRNDPHPNGKQGVAVAIRRYRFL